MSFFTEISLEDLNRLRNVVKTVHMKHYAERHITNYEIDKLIESIGPETAQKMLKVAVDSKFGD